MNGNGARRQRVVVAMSGGVDSAVAALLLLREGYDVRGMFMKNWEDDDTEAHCAAATDLEDAKEVCMALEIPFHKVNFAKQYQQRVFSHFVREYRSGRTPNPDVLCNREIKFGTFLSRALELGADRIATGHYAGTRTTHGSTRMLVKGTDANKDQSYFLHLLNQEQLVGCLFPLATMQKSEVRRLAESQGLHNHARRDSTGICFIGERRMGPFLRRYMESHPGPIRTLDGSIVGRHEGLCHYTIGQRQGLGIGGRAGTLDEPWYVAGKSMRQNELTVVQGHDHPALFSDMLRISRLHWISGTAPPQEYQLAAKIRYRQADQKCRIRSLDGEDCEVEFDWPQRAAAAGQSIVFYHGGDCLGGGIVESAQQRDDAGTAALLGEMA